MDAAAIPLDGRFPEWRDGRCFDVRIAASARVRDVLGHLFVLLPVLDDFGVLALESEPVDPRL